MLVRRLVAFAVLPLLIVSACGDDEGTDPAGFTEAEAEDVFDALGEVVGLFEELSDQQGTIAADVIAGQTTTLSRTRSCPKGGDATLEGTRSVTSSTFDADVEFTLDECAVRNVVLDGGFQIVFHAQASSATQITSTTTVSGNIEATHTSGRRRTCAIAYTQTLVSDASTGTEEVTEAGTICGRLVSTLSRD